MYYRIQEKGFNWEATKAHQSRNWGTLDSDLHQPLGGICACDNTDDLVALIYHWLPDGQYQECEILIFDGIPIRDVGDGWVVEPTREVERMEIDKFLGRYE